MIANKNQHTVNFQKMDGTTLSSIQDINQVGNKESQFKNSIRWMKLFSEISNKKRWRFTSNRKS